MCKNFNNIFIAGQLSGVEGYVESIASGLLCGINMARYLSGQTLLNFSYKTVIGALQNYIANANENNFQPMNANYAIMEELTEKIKDKKLKREILAKISLDYIQEIKEKFDVWNKIKRNNNYRC